MSPFLTSPCRLISLFGLVILFVPLCLASSAELKVELLTLDPNKKPTLRLTGPATGTYILEASRDLHEWWPVGDTVSQNGMLEVTHRSAAGYKALWFRGRSVTLAPDVVARHDTNWASSALVTTNGGAVGLLHPSGYYAVLTVPPFAVIEPVVVTMTAVTNLDGYPFASPCTAALKFEPDGLRFLSPALLEFHLSTNITAGEFATLGFQAEGKQLRLVPDAIGSNYINIPLSHFSGIAVGNLSRSEVLAAREKHVTDMFDRISHEAAVLILEERQKALQGEPGSPDFGARLMAVYRDFFDNQVKQLIDESLGDCATFRSLMQRVLSLGRTMALLGAAEDADLVWDYLMTRLCTGFSVCHNEILQECAAGRRSIEAIRQLLGIERQKQLLGMQDCDTGFTFEMLEQCTPQLWTGTFSYIEQGATNIYTEATDGGWENIDREYYYEISGPVRTTKTSNDRVEMEIPANLYGQFRSIRTMTGLDSLGEGCPAVQVYGYTSISAAAQGTNSIKLTLLYDQIYGTNLYLYGYDDRSAPLNAVQRELRVYEGPTCEHYPNEDPNTSSSKSSLTQFAASPIPRGAGGTLVLPPGSVTQDTVNVTFTGERVIKEVPVRYIFRLVVNRAK
jgi:hypothetical protein